MCNPAGVESINLWNPAVSWVQKPTKLYIVPRRRHRSIIVEVTGTICDKNVT